MPLSGERTMDRTAEPRTNTHLGLENGLTLRARRLLLALLLPTIVAPLFIGLLSPSKLSWASGNTPPTISDVADQTTNEDTALGPVTFIVSDTETPADDLMVFADSTNTVLVPVSSILLGGSGVTRTVTITPAQDQTGTSIISLIVSDGSDTAQDTFVLTVDPVNDGPTISAIAAQNTMSGTTTGPISFTVGDVDTPLASLVLTATSSDPALTPLGEFHFAGADAERSLTLTPTVGLTGTAIITVNVSDGSLSADSPFTLTVLAPNQPPNVSGVADQATDEDTTLVFDFAVNDDRTALSSLVITTTSGDALLVPPGNLTVTGADVTRTLTVTPAVNRWGTTVITVEVSDGELVTTAPFTLTVNSVDDPPVIDDIPGQSTPEDTPIQVTFTISDVDTDVASLNVSASSTDGSLVANSDMTISGAGVTRTLTITPTQDQFGQAAMVVRASDGANLTIESFLLTVVSVNDLPTISAISDQTIQEDSALTALPFTVDDVETDPAALTVTVTSTNQSLLPDANLLLGGSGGSRTLTATPVSDVSGTAELVIVVDDGQDTAETRFLLSVQEVNDLPTISSVSDQNTTEDTPITVTFTVADVETPAGNLQLSAISSDEALLPGANVTFGGSGGARTATITPGPDLAGSGVLTLTVSDGQASASEAFTITVTPVNDPPELSSVADQETPEDTPITVTFTLTDVDNPVAGITLTVTSSNQSLLPDANLLLNGDDVTRTLTMTPVTGAYGTALVTVSVDDGTDATAKDFVLTVNDRPTLAPIADQVTDEDTPLDVAITVGDNDTALSALSLSAVSSDATLIPASGMAFTGSGGSRTLTLSPAENLFGATTITVTVSDGVSASQESFLLTVNPVNDAPEVSGLADRTINQDEATSYQLNVSDVDSNLANVTLSGVSTDPTLLPSSHILFGGAGASRTMTVTPASGQSGVVTVTVTADDGADSSAASFVLTVNARPAIQVVDALDMAEDATESLGITLSDLDNLPGSLTLSAASDDQGLIPDSGLVLGGSGANRTLAVTPAANANGTALITLEVSDGLATASRVVTVTVAPVNDAPTIDPIADQTTEEDTPAGPIPFTIGDIDSDVASLTLHGSSSDTALVPHTNIEFGGTGINRTVSITPTANLTGTATITVTVSDGALNASSVFTLSVQAVNDAPVIAPIPDQETREDTPIQVSFQVSDIDSALAAVSVSGSSSNHALVDDSDITFSGSGGQRTVTITPRPDQYGSTTITLVASDGSLTGSATFALTVTPENDSPLIASIPNVTMEEDITHTLTITLSDVDTDAALLVLSGVSSNPTLIPDRNLGFSGTGITRTLTITPAANQVGSATLTIYASDGQIQGHTAFVAEVQPVNDAPVAVDDTVSRVGVTEFSIGVLANDRDVDGDRLTVTAVEQGRVGSVTINPDSTLRYVAPAGFLGWDSFTYTVSDGNGGTDSATVQVIVSPPPALDMPAVTQLLPVEGDNSRSTSLTVLGNNFEATPEVRLGPYLLADVTYLDSQRLAVTVPAFLPPGDYDLIVTNPDGRSAVFTAGYRVTTDEITLQEVRPDRGWTDVATEIHVYGMNFAQGATVFLDATALETEYVDATHLQAAIPANLLAPGSYAVTVVNPGGDEDTQANAYTVVARDSDDLFGFSYEFWSQPNALRVGQSALLGIVVHRQGGEFALVDVPVRFYLGAPSAQGQLLGVTSLESLVPDHQMSTPGITWTPTEPGNYTLYAVIDPDNQIPETDETNNVLMRSVTVMPLVTDVLPPQIDELSINDGALIATSRDVRLSVRATDQESGVRAVKFVEYKYIAGVDRWIPVQESTWLDYVGAPATYDWRLVDTPGIKYILAWVSDRAGNVSESPVLAGINYLPAQPDTLAAGEARVFRYPMAIGEQMSAFVMPRSGDPDLYVWPPDHETRSPWISQQESGPDEVSFVAPVAGEYQVEVHGITDAVYELVTEIRGVGATGWSELQAFSSVAKSPPVLPVLPVADRPLQRYRLPLPPTQEVAGTSANYRLFLPTVLR